MPIERADLENFQKYLQHLWVCLGIEAEVLENELAQERNAGMISAFASDYQIRVLLIWKNREGKISTSLEWGSEIMGSNGVLLIKKNNFLLKGGGPLKIGEMVQTITIDLKEEDPMSTSFQMVNKLLVPLMGIYRTELEKKSTTDKNTFNNIVKKVNELNFSFAQCQETVHVPEVNLEVCARVKEIIETRQTDKYLSEPELIGVEELARICEDVTKWNRDMEGLLKHQHEMMISTTVQEQLFWNNYSNALKHLNQQTEKEEVKFAISLIKKKNKFLLEASFNSVIVNLKKMTEKALDINSFFKELKLQEMMTAQTIDELVSILHPLMSHFKKIGTKDYERRIYPLIEVLSRDLGNQVHKILSRENLMFCPFPDFKAWYEKCDDIFKKFEEGVSSFITKQSRTSAPSRLASSTGAQKAYYHFLPLKGRLEQLFRSRELYQKLKTVIDEIVARTAERGFLTTVDIEEGYSAFKGLNVLDTTKEGEEELGRAEKEFNHRIDIAETYITKRLREKLGATTNANEMFRIFAKFNGLYFRPRIKAAIEEYQSQLIKKVREGIGQLDEKFKISYIKTENTKICKARDIPRNSGSIIWAKQITIKLEKYLEKISHILMESWADHPEGKECKQKIEALLKKLNTEHIIKQWEKKTL